jgi:hypothetical protein
MIITYVNNKLSSFYSTGVGYTIQLGYESAKYLLYQRVIQHKSRLTITSKVLKVNKITNIKHVSIKY